MNPKFILFALGIFSPIIGLDTILFGQNQIYKGPYRAALTGNVYYEYQDIEGSRVKNGKYIFNSNNDSYSVSVTGTYKNGEKNGHWKTIAKTNGSSFLGWGVSDSNIAAIVSGNSTIVEGDYVNDKREGEWTFYQTGTDIIGGDMYYNSTANFSRGYFTGDIVVSAKAYGSEYSLKGQFAEITDKREEQDEKPVFYLRPSNTIPYPSGTWVVKWTNSDGFQYMLNVTFEQGSIVSIKSTDFSTGEEIEDYSKYINDFSKPYNRIKLLKIFVQGFLPDPMGELLKNWIWDSTLTVLEDGVSKTSVNIYYKILE